MTIKYIVTRGFGLDPGSAKFIVTRGFGGLFPITDTIMSNILSEILAEINNNASL